VAFLREFFRIERDWTEWKAPLPPGPPPPWREKKEGSAPLTAPSSKATLPLPPGEARDDDRKGGAGPLLLRPRKATIDSVLANLCPQQCGYVTTWNDKYCCHTCWKSGGQHHGVKCAKKTHPSGGSVEEQRGEEQREGQREEQREGEEQREEQRSREEREGREDKEGEDRSQPTEELREETVAEGEADSPEADLQSLTRQQTDLRRQLATKATELAATQATLAVTLAKRYMACKATRGNAEREEEERQTQRRDNRSLERETKRKRSRDNEGRLKKKKRRKKRKDDKEEEEEEEGEGEEDPAEPASPVAVRDGGAQGSQNSQVKEELAEGTESTKETLSTSELAQLAELACQAHAKRAVEVISELEALLRTLLAQIPPDLASLSPSEVKVCLRQVNTDIGKAQRKFLDYQEVIIDVANHI